MSKMVKRRYLLWIMFLLLTGFFAGRQSVKIFPGFSFRRPAAKPMPVSPPKPAPGYSYDGKYIAQTDYYKMYSGKYKAVMLGNSHIQRVHWNELLNRCDIANRGIGGDVMEGMYHRLETVIGCKPDVVFVEGGINDIELGVEYSKYMTQLTYLVDTLKLHNIKPVVFSVIYVADGYPGAMLMNDKVARFNRGIDSLANAKNVDVVNLNNHLSEHGFLMNKFVQGDKIHLNKEAYIIWADKLKRYL